MENKAIVEGILDRAEKRIELLASVDTPTFKLIALPVSVDCPIIKPTDIYDLYGNYVDIKRIAGGVCSFDSSNGNNSNPLHRYLELNEYGIVYYRQHFPETPGISYFINSIKRLLEHVKRLYKACEVPVNIQIIAELHNVFRRKLDDNLGRDNSIYLSSKPVCYDSEVFVKTAEVYASGDFEEITHQKGILKELTMQLLWSFNVPIDADGVKNYVEYLIDLN